MSLKSTYFYNVIYNKLMNRNIVYITIEGIFLKNPIEKSYKEKFILSESCFQIFHFIYIKDENIPSNWIEEYGYILEKYAGYSCYEKLINIIESIIDSNIEYIGSDGINISIQHDYFAKDIEVHYVPIESLKEVFKEIRLALPRLEHIPILLQD